MKSKIIAATLALTLAPSVALAMGCSYGEHKQAASCQAGSTWDADKGLCVASPTG